MQKQTAQILLKIKAVTLRINPPYKWTSGILSPIYTDNRILMSYIKEREKIIDFFINIIEENNIKAEIIAGIATSGIPYAAWISEKLNLPMVYIRNKTKEYGKENLIEGKIEKGKTAVVIEDLISTGGSSLRGVEALRNAGCKVNYCLAIFNYGLKKAKNNFEKSNCKLISLTNFNQLVKTGVEENYLDENEKEKVIEWSENPEQWEK